MSNSSDPGDEPPKTKPSKSQVIFMLGTMADTTWRMFIPTIGLAVLGVWADIAYHTRPWCTTTGIIVGTIIAGVLVKQQLQRDK